MGGREYWSVTPKYVAYAALAVTLACRREPPMKRYQTECAGHPPGVDFPARLRDSIQDPGPSSSWDHRSIGISRRFPSYGGYAYRGKFFLLRFTDTLVGRGLLDTIVRLEQIENPDTLPFQLAQVRWSYAQLYDWYWYLSPRLMRNDKVFRSEMDTYANRIIFHVSDTVVRHQTDSQLVAWSVPCGLVRLQLPQR